MDNLKEKQIKEAQIRKEILSKKYNLKSDVFNLDKFKQNEKYAKIIEKCEKENNRLVYHCILTYGRILNLLFVSKYEDDWKNERPYESEENITYVVSYTYDLEEDFTEIGDIFLNSENGDLIRVN